MPKYFRDLKKKCWGGGGLCPNILDFKNVSGGGGMPTNFLDLKKLRGEGYAQIFHRLENCWCGGMPTNFMDSKKMLVGGGGLCQNILWI